MSISEESPHIIDATMESFAADVLEASAQMPVIVDFWAPGYSQCQEVTPALEKLTKAANGAVRLVRVNIAENQQLATELRIQSVPTVYAFKDGRGIDGFQGAMPESQLRGFFERLIGEVGPTEGETIIEEAQAFLEAGDIENAGAGFASALQAEPENLAALTGLAKCQIAIGDFEAAKSLLDSVPQAKASDPEVAAARAALELAESAGHAATDLAPLLAAIEENPKDMGARMDLAEAQLAAGTNEEAVETLLDMVRLDRAWNDEAARKKLVTLFDAFGPTSELTLSTRRQLSSILFS